MKISIEQIPIIQILSKPILQEVDNKKCYWNKTTIKPHNYIEKEYNINQKRAVINTIINNLFVGNIYWYKNKNSFDMLWGQQKVISIISYENNEFTANSLLFKELSIQRQEQIYNHKLHVVIGDNFDECIEWIKVLQVGIKNEN